MEYSGAEFRLLHGILKGLFFCNLFWVISSLSRGQAEIIKK